MEPLFVLFTLNIDVFVFWTVVILWNDNLRTFVFIVEFIALLTFFAYSSASVDPFTMLFSFGIDVLIFSTVVIFLWKDNLLAFAFLIKFIAFIALFADNFTTWNPFSPLFSLMINVFVFGTMVVFFWNYNFFAFSFIIKLIAFFAFFAYYFTSCHPFAPLFSFVINVFVFGTVIILFRNFNFDTFPLVVQLITFITFFTDLFASRKPLMIFLSLYINPFVLSTMIILWFWNLFTASFGIHFVAIRAISTFSILVGGFTVFWKFSALRLLVQVVSFVTLDANLFATWKLFFMVFSFWVNEDIFAAMIFNWRSWWGNDFDTSVFWVKFEAAVTLFAYSVVIVSLAVLVTNAWVCTARSTLCAISMWRSSIALSIYGASKTWITGQTVTIFLTPGLTKVTDSGTKFCFRIRVESVGTFTTISIIIILVAVGVFRCFFTQISDLGCICASDQQKHHEESGFTFYSF